MPNHCENKLILQANTPEELGLVRHFLGSIQEQGQDDNLNFNRLLPMPEEEKENWYEWSIQNWGTKWNCYDVLMSDITTPEYEKPRLEYNFMTAWSPMADNLVRILSKEFPKVHCLLYYSEPGMMFGGCTTAFAGEYETVNTWELNPCLEHYESEGQELLHDLSKKEAEE
jgi:hypothetical protein